MEWRLIPFYYLSPNIQVYQKCDRLVRANFAGFAFNRLPPVGVPVSPGLHPTHTGPFLRYSYEGQMHARLKVG